MSASLSASLYMTLCLYMSVYVSFSLFVPLYYSPMCSILPKENLSNKEGQRDSPPVENILLYLDYKKRSMLAYILIIEGLYNVYKGSSWLEGDYNTCTLIVPLCNLYYLCAHPVIWFDLPVEKSVFFYGAVAVYTPGQCIRLN